MKEEKDVRKDYEALCKKHRLPGFDELDKEFELSSIEDSFFLIRRIKACMMEKANDVIDFLAEVIQPDTNITSMYESRIFGEEEKKAMFEVFKKLMKWRRLSLEVHISSDDARAASFIRDFFAEWKQLKPQLEEIISKVKAFWETESEQIEKLGYFG